MEPIKFSMLPTNQVRSKTVEGGQWRRVALLGMHQIEVTYENIPVPGSPFRVNAVPGCDPMRVRAYGPGLEHAITNEPTTFTIETKGAGQGSLGLAIEGPSEAKMVCKNNQDGTCLMEYLPVSERS